MRWKITKMLFFDYHRLIAEETEKSLEDSQKRLSQRERELHNQEERGLALEEKCGELKRALEIAKDDISQLRATINAMDREKDSLQHTVDEKTEKIAHLNEDILHKVSAVAVFMNCMKSYTVWNREMYIIYSPSVKEDWYMCNNNDT